MGLRVAAPAHDPPAAFPDPPPGGASLLDTIARCVLLLLPVALASVWLRLQHAQNGELGFPIDDPYIHFQFARNLATGHGFAFNRGEPTPGATSPLWVLILGACRAAGLPIEGSALALGIGLAGAAAWLTYEVGRSAGLGRAAALLAGLAVAACGRVTWASLSGMEIGLATVASLAVVRVLQSRWEGVRRGATLGLATGLAAAARPEMMLLAPLTLAVEAWRTRGAWRVRPWVAFALTCAALVLPYIAFSLATTGRPLPNTFYAKAVLGFPDHSLPHWRMLYLPYMLLAALYDNPVLGALLIPGLAVWAWRREPRSALVLLWPLAFWTYALAVFPRHFTLSRYTMPLIPFLSLMSVAAFGWAHARVRGPKTRHAALIAAAVAVAASAAWSQVRYTPVYLANVDNILHMQVQMGRWVKTHTAADARIATNDVGAITYLGGRYCVDTVGLVSADRITHALEQRRLNVDIHPDLVLASYLRAKRVDYVIVFPSWYPDLIRLPWLSRVGRIRYPNSTGGDDELAIYRVVQP